MQLPVGFSDQLEVGYFSLIHPLAIWDSCIVGTAAVGRPFPPHFSCFPDPQGNNCTAGEVAIGRPFRPHRSIHFPEHAEPLSI